MRSKVALVLITLVVTLVVSGVVLFIQRLQRSAGTTSGSTSEVRPQGIPTPLDLDALLRNIALTQSPIPGPPHPARIQIESAGIDILVLTISVDPDGFLDTPVHYAGYWGLSAALGANDNIVIVGHNRPEPRPIFLNLSLIKTGDGIVVTDQFGKQYHYKVDTILKIKVEGVSPAEANRPAHYVQPTGHEQLTLLTCYPESSCTDRLIVLASPAK
jgi:LPXTG-site transpeptidase (sortase) family protein